jgi:hypothetical protein
MTWIKVDDSFGDHPKVMALGRDRMAGLGVWMAAACYCARHLTDGFVPASVAQGFGHVRILERLVTVGLLDKVTGGYQLHDWLDYNPPRTKVLKDRQDAKDRMNKLRSSSEVQPNDERTTDEHSPKFGDPVPVPVPTPIHPYQHVEPRDVYLERTRRRKLSQKEADWLEDMHAHHSRTSLVAALYAIDVGPDYLKRVKAYLDGRAA